ncbi:PssE/Cps14G family polysaccharide biosynthesis glycosyltransferase [Shewanella sp. UCD-KL12]|uniref:PssE/Cps14G family polysaccharide biosynthesis glycosyltransferase n=1 Tax=Shewanella sp. UCD-KL12 TaxID=1917163 RepID=UPI0009713058|nr:PssE/Cps14G family polysaccharide biosynthesis glycosyltransferase [Shewanella sp. UCD-KL12]
MNIFVTVGHTRFDSLFKQIDEISRTEWHFVSQMSDGSYIPKTGEHFSYSSNIQTHYENADVVITHAGAGSVFTLLEMGKPTIVIANIDRVDTHQEDLLRFVETSEFAQVCRNLSTLEALLNNVSKFEAKPYCSEPFFAANEIAERLKLID